MLRLFTLLFIALTIVSCKQEQPTKGYLINGNFDASFDNRKIKLLKFENNKETLIDSATILNGKITFKGFVENPDIYYFVVDGAYGNLPLVVENKQMTITFHKNSLIKSEIKGSEENDLLKIYLNDSDDLQTKSAQYGTKIRIAKNENDSLEMAELRSEFEKIMELTNTKHLELIKVNTNLVSSAAILENMLRLKQLTTIEAEEIFNTFSEQVQSSRFGLNVKQMLQATLTDVGNLAPNFTAPNPQGEAISLNDIKGKVTIIDFWAAWCGPCRKENPNVVKVYEKYHDKGLEIIGVSLDGTPKQQDAKAAWLEAIEKDKLTWYQVSNLNYFNDPIAKLYNIQAIPATFILDSNGTIVAKNLRGDALDAKIAELLN